MNTSVSSQPVHKRYDSLDIAKALTIFLVLIGHTVDTYDKPMFRPVLYSFHMPLFFMASGTVIRRHHSSGCGWKHWPSFLRKNILAIAVPYLIWALLFSQFSIPNTLKILYGSWEMLKEVGTVSSLWFLPRLFVARILMELVLMFSRRFPGVDRHLFAAVAAAPCFAIGFLLPHPAIRLP